MSDILSYSHDIDLPWQTTFPTCEDESAVLLRRTNPRLSALLGLSFFVHFERFIRRKY